MVGVEIPSWIFSAESMASDLETAFDDARLTLSLGGSSVGSSVVDLAIAGGWEGGGADAAELATSGVAAKFTDLAISCQTASQLCYNYKEDIGDVADRIDRLKGDLSNAQDDVDEAEDDQNWAERNLWDRVAWDTGADQARDEVSRIEGEIETAVAEAIVIDYQYGSSISLTLDAIAQVVNVLYGPSDVINVNGSPFESVLRENQILPTQASQCTTEIDERLKVTGPLEPPWEEEEEGDGGWGFWDWTQGVLDVLGLVPGLGEIADGANVIISGGRAIFDPDNRGEHLTNMALSGAAMIPFAGWGATATKFGRYADEAVEAADTANDIRRGTRTIDGVDESTEALFRSRYGLDELPDGFKVEDGRIVDPNGNWMDSAGRWRRPDGSFAQDPLGGPRTPDGVDRVDAGRETREEVLRNQPRNENGELIDSNGNVVDEDWMDLGHQRGFENWRLREKYENGEITLDEWKEIANDPDIYEYQDRSLNRSHRDELETPDSPDLDDYLRDNGYI